MKFTPKRPGAPLLLAVGAPLLTSGRQRRAGLLFGAATVVLLAGPIFVSEYDYRFTIPAFGPLAATAAIGAWGAAVRLRPRTGPSQHASHSSTTARTKLVRHASGPVIRCLRTVRFRVKRPPASAGVGVHWQFYDVLWDGCGHGSALPT